MSIYVPVNKCTYGKCAITLTIISLHILFIGTLTLNVYNYNTNKANSIFCFDFYDCLNNIGIFLF